MRGSRRTKTIVWAIAVALLLWPAARAGAERDEKLVKCVEGGGIYYDDGRCEGGTNADPPAEPPADAPADEVVDAPAEEADPDASEKAAKKACRKQGGSYRNGECRMDSVTRCKSIGGTFMVNGECFKPGR